MKQEQDISAKCLECEWSSNTQNSHPNAKKHSKRTGHKVRVNWGFTYSP